MASADLICKQKQIIMKQNVIIAGQTKTLQLIAMMLPKMIPDPRSQADVEKIVASIKEMVGIAEQI